jgi:hypothetical protein
LICLIKNLFEYRNITSKIHDNLINYPYSNNNNNVSIRTSYIPITIRYIKKKKSESRYRQMISMMIENNDKKYETH